MKYSYSLLRPFVTIPTDIQTLADDLTSKVCEVEEIIERIVPDKIVIGKVVEVRKHPEADKLNVTRIDCGVHGVFQICTGGENVQAHTYVPVAIPGCYLPALDLKIEPRMMRGLESNGMICSKSEIGIPEDQEHHRIRTLQYSPEFADAEKKSPADMHDISDADCGIPLKQKYPRIENRMLDVDNKTLTHRPDLFGHFGLANEIVTLYGEEIVTGLMKTREHLSQKGEHPKIAERSVRLETEGVNMYHLVELENIQVYQSDLERRLIMMDIGSTPRMNRVDLSNIFMYQMGHPIHCFDAEKVSGDVIVRNAKEGELFVDLFGKEHVLIANDIVIADEKGVLSLAGIVGGQTCGVTESTKHILVEIAQFDPVQLRRTAMRLGLRTDAELRYEKHINPAFTQGMLEVFLAYIKDAEWLGSFELKGVCSLVRDEAMLAQIQKKSLSIQPTKIAELIRGEGSAYDMDQAKGILERLGCKVESNITTQETPDVPAQMRTVHIPVRRSPSEFVYGEELVEEVARIQGYDSVESRAYTTEPVFMPFSREVYLQRKIEEYLSSVVAMNQVETYPWHEQEYIDILELSSEHLYELENPTAPEARFMRDTMIWHLVEMVRRNSLAYDTVRVFDLGKTWNSAREKREHKTVAFAVWTKNGTDRQNDLRLQMRGIVGGLLQQITGEKNYTIQSIQKTYFHPQQQGMLCIDGKNIGTLATVHPYVLDALKMPSESRLVVAEIDLELVGQILDRKSAMREVQENSETTYETLQDQIIWKDLSFVIPRGAAYGDIELAIRSVEKIADVEMFDLYVGDRIGADKKSISVRLKIRGEDTMTAEQINEIMASAIEKAETTGAELRK